MSFPSPKGGGGAGAYKAKKRRLPKLATGLGQEVLRRARKQYVKDRPAPTPRTPLNPGKKPPSGGGLKPLPPRQRKALKGQAPTTEPNTGPKSSAPYRAAKRRTAAKFRRRGSKRGF